MRGAWIVAIGMALSGCGLAVVSQSAPWKRADGSPVNAGQLETDRAICDGQSHYDATTGGAAPIAQGPLWADLMRKCMAQRGYILVGQLY